MNPITFFNFDTPAGFSEPVWKTKRIEEIVRRTREFIMKGVNFWELRKNENTALKANCEAQISEYVDTGRYWSPTEYK